MLRLGVAALAAGLASAAHGGPPMAADQLHTGMPLKEPVTLWSPRALDPTSTTRNVYLELTYTTCEYHGPYTSFITRCYEYMGVAAWPGPTIYILPGDTITLKLLNTLSPKDDVKYHNYFQHLNYTNLHIHGGHVSSNVPGDNVLPLIAPQDDDHVGSITYVWEFHDYHMPGTLWYHPHGHGSATVQTGTGSNGMVIILDEDSTVPSYIKNAEEKLLNIDHFNLEQMGNFGAQTCSNSDIMVPSASGSEGSWPALAYTASGMSGIVTVNSMTEPVLPMETGKWYRLRMLMASTMYMINGNGVGESVGSCTFLLMAKDSIYLFDSLRPISKLFLYPGSRADIMAKCDMPGDVMFESAYFAGQEALTHHVPNYVGPIFNLSVVESAHHEPMLPQFEVQRPCYVADTQSILGDEAYVTKKPIIYDVCEAYPGGGAPPVEHRKLAGEFNEDGTHYWTYSDMPGTSGYAQAFGMTCNQLADNIFQARTGLYCVNGCALELGTRHGVGNYTGTQTTTLMSQDNEAAVAAAHEVNEYYGTPCLLVNEDQHLTVGTIVEWDVWGIDYHPVHFHVNPYQLVDIDYELGNQQGVTFDAAQFELLTGNFYHLGDYGDVMMIPAKHVTLHQQLNNFASAMVNHCHILFHEDVGMMNVYAINGEDGTFARSQEVDPMCYWTSAQKTGYSVTAVCHSDLDCPTGWACHMSSDEDEDRRRALKFGHMTGGVCTEMEM